MPNHLELVRKAAEALKVRERAVDDARAKLHARIVDAHRAGETNSAIARAADVSRQWIMRVLEKK